ncbi:DUF1349 domain-containing protein [Bacteroides oleiciplenus]|uniref:DUF1349 domain-containing protein n=1 Tax=Bacteroides oleiciplenus TaxID=626931 RepID=A0A3E5B6P1_9BACE|nr:DUF1349 domain-containing protein [Bacteroides oleiciplenus]RGN33271.1 DUF1349 domain-containing protein [Bacteroides oleiciplenus]
MKKRFIYLAMLSSCLLLDSCAPKGGSAEGQTASLSITNTEPSNSTACEIKYGNVTFTRAINGADSLVTLKENGVLEFRCGAKKDFFCDPNDGKLSNNTAPLLLAKVDNTQPFTITAKVTPGFTATGTYNAADLFVFSNDTLWQKFAFEQDERGRNRIVTVRTNGTSDDNNHEEVTAASVYLKISSDSRTIASYYSLDKKEWQLVRLYKNYYPKELWVGLCNQCPMEDGSISLFEDVTLEQNSVEDFRSGD